MKRTVLVAVCLIAGILTVIAASNARAATRMVLLNNGSLIEGRVTQEAGRTVLIQPGGELRLDPGEVAVVVDGPLQAYAWLREQRGGAAEDCMDLADWAMRHSLWPQAARELLEARALAPGSPRVELLERRLSFLSRAPTQPPSSKSTPEKPPGVEPASHEAPQSNLTAEAAELETFSRRIQPILVNNCTSGGCHSAQHQGGFRLDRRLVHGHGDARSTKQNLRAVLAAIDTENPEQSGLIRATLGQHAGVTPFTGPHAPRWRERISVWVESVVASNRAPVAEAVDASRVAGQQAEITTPEEPEATRGVSETPPSSPKRGAQLAKVEPRDEFDPEIFNRRYRRPEDDLPLN